jgi:hypothetical protein
LVAAGVAEGRIAKIHSSSSFTLEIFETTAQPKVNPAAGRRGVPPVQYRLNTKKRPFVLDVADDVVVRVMQLPLQFDDMGKPKKYTAEEKKELRGKDPNLPGYKSDYDSLKPGQIVRVFFRTGHAVTPPDKAEFKDVDKKQPDESSRVRMIVVLSDGDSAKAGGKDDAKPPMKK